MGKREIDISIAFIPFAGNMLYSEVFCLDAWAHPFRTKGIYIAFCSGQVGILFGKHPFKTKEKCTAFRSALGHHSFNEAFRLGTLLERRAYTLLSVLDRLLILKRKNNCCLFHVRKTLAFCSIRVIPDVLSIKLAKIAIFANMLAPSLVIKFA